MTLRMTTAEYASHLARKGQKAAGLGRGVNASPAGAVAQEIGS